MLSEKATKMVENGEYNVRTNHVFYAVNYWLYKCYFMRILVVYYLFLILIYLCMILKC